MKFDVEYALIEKTGAESERGKGVAAVTETGADLHPENSTPVSLEWREVIELSGADYKVLFKMPSGDALELSGLGYKYEDFLRIASGFRNNFLIKDALIDESDKTFKIEAEYACSDASGKSVRSGPCGIFLYETAVMIIPPAAEFRKLPFREISRVSEDGFEFCIVMDSGETFRLSKFGGGFDYFKKEFFGAINAMNLMSQDFIKSVASDTAPMESRKASLVLKEGKLISFEKMENACPGFAAALERFISRDADNAKEFAHLKSLSRREKICFGFKKGLMGALSGDYIIVLFPVYAENPSLPGNAVIMEAFNLGNDGGKTEGGAAKKSAPPAMDKTAVPGTVEFQKQILSMMSAAASQAGQAGKPETKGEKRATYFFKLASRKDYPLTKSIAGLDEKMNVFLGFFNTAMSAVNFRRAPLFLPDAKLYEPRYVKYRAAAAKIPELRALRDFYIGRVIHSSYESWVEDIGNILAFNVHSSDDSAKWLKSAIGDAGDGEIDNEDIAETENASAQEKK